jgi:hypothetical protein
VTALGEEVEKGASELVGGQGVSVLVGSKVDVAAARRASAGSRLRPSA